MNEQVRDSLCRILRDYGRGLIEEPRRCESLLSDLCPNDRREVHILISALRERIPADLVSSTATQSSAALVVERLSKKLEQELGMAEEAARWGVRSWAVALGVALPDPAAPSPPPRPPAGPVPRRDCYEVLGLRRDASAQQIAQAYQNLAGRHTGAAAAEIAQAHAVLSDPAKRKEYDMFGFAGLHFHPGSGHSSAGDAAPDADDLLKRMFG